MKLKGIFGTVAVIGMMAAGLYMFSGFLAPVAQHNAEAECNEMMMQLLPGSTAFEVEAYSGEDESIKAVFKADHGYIIETVTAGYAGDITMLVGVNNDGVVTGVVMRNMEETYGLGANALHDTAFLGQFLGTDGEATVGETIDALTGATVTSKAITRGVNAAAGFVTGADVTSSATEWEG